MRIQNRGAHCSEKSIRGNNLPTCKLSKKTHKRKLYLHDRVHQEEIQQETPFMNRQKGKQSVSHLLESLNSKDKAPIKKSKDKVGTKATATCIQ
jgi:hypothetical protein